MRKTTIIGNWKTNKTIGEVKEFFAAFDRLAERKTISCEYGVAPVFAHLQLAKALARPPMLVAAQDANAAASGAYTGTVSWAQLKDLGVTHAIVGHSERRTIYGETDAAVNEKLKALLGNGMVGILCVGENAAQFDAKQTDAVCAAQLEAALADVDPALAGNLIVAYEPIWAIGTGKTATPQIAQAAIASIRARLARLLSPAIAADVKILYGGSVNPKNVAELVRQPDIDGALVGNASLDPESFAELLD